MKFGIFDYIDRRDEPAATTFDERMALLRAAEEAGFHGYHLTEHHASPLSLAPSPTVFLAAAARETKRLRLGTLLYLLPLYNPVRLDRGDVHARSSERRAARYRRRHRRVAASSSPRSAPTSPPRANNSRRISRSSTRA